MRAKSRDAFRTISEVADWLDVPAHVLRFWESKFTQVKPVKRAGGRRYYRPADMDLLGGIRKLLHDDGMTIRGVQKILREKGVRHVSDLSLPILNGKSAEEIEPELQLVAAPAPASGPPQSADPARSALGPVVAAAREGARDAEPSASGQTDTSLPETSPRAAAEPVAQDVAGTESVREAPTFEAAPGSIGDVPDGSEEGDEVAAARDATDRNRCGCRRTCLAAR